MKLDLLNEISLLRDALKEEHEAYRGPHAEDAGHCSLCLLIKRADGILARCSSPDSSTAPAGDESDLDVHVCIDCGRAFLSGHRRDAHFMSDDCKWQGRYDEEGCEHQDSPKLIKALAVQFVANLADAGIDLKRIDRENKKIAKGCCASHDQCDANMYMHPAFCTVLGHDPELMLGNCDLADGPLKGDADDCILWGKAWDFAKKTGFVKLAKEGASGAGDFFTKLAVCVPDTLADSGHDGAYIDVYISKHQVNDIALVHVCLTTGWQVLQLNDDTFWTVYGDEMAGTYRDDSFNSLCDAIEWLRPLYVACVAEIA